MGVKLTHRVHLVILFNFYLERFFVRGQIKKVGGGVEDKTRPAGKAAPPSFSVVLVLPCLVLLLARQNPALSSFSWAPGCSSDPVGRPGAPSRAKARATEFVSPFRPSREPSKNRDR